MPLDLPDFTRKMSLDVDINAPFLKEIITHNYGIHSIDSLGKIVFIENFGNGISHWCQYPASAAGEIRIDTKYFSSAGYSCYLYAGTATNVSSLLTHLLPIYDTSKVGVELKFLFYTYPGVLWVETHFYTKEGVKYLSFEIDYLAKKIIVYNQDWDEIELDLNIYATSSICFWHNIKAVVDLDNSKFDRLQYNQYNLTGLDIALPTHAAYNYEYARLDLSINSRAYYRPRVYIDDIIVTINEP